MADADDDLDALDKLAHAAYVGGAFVVAALAWTTLLERQQALVAAGYEQFRPWAARTAMHAGTALYRAGRLDDALAHFDLAGKAFADLIAAGHELFLGSAADTAMNAGATLVAADRLDDALARFDLAAQAYADLIAAGHEQFHANAAIAAINAGAALAKAGRPDDALARLDLAAKTSAERIAAGHEQFRAYAARAEGEAGNALLGAHRLDDALARFNVAAKAYANLIAAGHEQFRADAALMAMNAGIALSEAGRLDEAVTSYALALEAFETLVAAGYEKFRADAAATIMNAGNALVRARRLEEGLACFDQADRVYADLIAAGHEQFRADAATTALNASTCLQEAGRIDDALARLDLAAKGFADLVAAGHKKFRAHAATTALNAGNALTSAGRLDDALARFDLAAKTYADLIGAGQEQLRASAALTALSAGNALIRAGRLDDALDSMMSATAGYHRLLTQGNQWQFVAEAGVALAEAWHIWWKGQPVFNARRLSQLEEMLRSADAWLQVDKDLFDPQLELVKAANGMLTDIDADRYMEVERLAAGLAQSVPDLGPDTLPALQSLGQRLDALLHRALQALARLLRDGKPDWLLSRQARINAVVDSLAQTCAQRGDRLVAEWFLATQGLRAQRAALQGSSDPDLIAYESMLLRMDELSRWVMGGSVPDGSTPLVDRWSLDKPIASQLSKAPARQRYWLAQHAELKAQARAEAMRLQKLGKLPEAQQLTLPGVFERLLPQQALVLLCAAPPGSGAPQSVANAATVWLLVLRRPADVPGGAPVQLARLALDMAVNARQLLDVAGQAVQGRGLPMRHGPGLRVGLAAAPTTATTATTTSPAHFDATCTAIAQALSTAMVSLGLADATTVHFVPSGPLHALPWTWLAGLLSGGAQRWHLYPSAAAWHRCTLDQAATTAARTPLWALLAHDAWPQRTGTSHDPILWVQVEAWASALLWNGDDPLPRLHRLAPNKPQWPPPGRGDAAPVNALLGIGHGGAPDGNLARAGLLLGQIKADGATDGSVFSAADLHRIRQAQRVLMSCCVLAHTGDVLGEPLGMLADGFGYSVRQAVGALVRVGDLEGLLISLAFQWVLRQQAADTSTASPDWPGAFTKLQRRLAEGHWPDGFGDWLAETLPAALSDAGVVPSLQQCAPPAEDRQRAAKLRQAWHFTLEGQMQALGLGDKPTWWNRDWDDDIRRFSAHLAGEVPESVRGVVRWYVALGK